MKKGSSSEDMGKTHTIVGYCSMHGLSAFVLDPPRGRSNRVALVLFARADEEEGLQIHKLEYIEPDQVQQAIQCMQRLRRLSKSVVSESTKKRSHAVSLGTDTLSPCDTKKARKLHAAPTAASLPEP